MCGGVGGGVGGGASNLFSSGPHVGSVFTLKTRKRFVHGVDLMHVIHTDCQTQARFRDPRPIFFQRLQQQSSRGGKAHVCCCKGCGQMSKG